MLLLQKKGTLCNPFASSFSVRCCYCKRRGSYVICNPFASSFSVWCCYCKRRGPYVTLFLLLYCKLLLLQKELAQFIQLTRYNSWKYELSTKTASKILFYSIPFNTQLLNCLVYIICTEYMLNKSERERGGKSLVLGKEAVIVVDWGPQLSYSYLCTFLCAHSLLSVTSYVVLFLVPTVD